MIGFAAPDAFACLAGIPLLVLILVLGRRARERDLALLAGAVAPRLTRGERSRAAPWFRLLALAALVVALADPRFGPKVEELTRRGVDVVVVLDLSHSMEARDVAPSRMQEARAEVMALVEALDGDRVGLIGFSGVADVLMPLTFDRGAFRMFLEMATPGLLPIPGTDLGAGLAAALKALGEEDLKYKVVVLVSDGEDNEGKGLEIARDAAERGVRIHTVGVGGAGGPIPAGDGFKRDRKGETVFSRPDLEGLARIAQTTGGGLYALQSPRLELGELAAEITAMEDRDLHAEQVGNMEERFQWPLALGLVLLGIERWLVGRAAGKGRP